MLLVPLTQGYFAKVDDEDAWVLNGPKWQVLKSKRHPIIYARRNKPGRGAGTELLHRVVMKVSDPKVHVDHQDGDGLNCQKGNLRPGSRKSNIRNQDPTKRPGVNWAPKQGKWYAQIMADGRNYNLGHHATRELALEARRAGELKYWGYIPSRRRGSDDPS